MSGSNNVLITDTDLTQARRLQEQTSSLPNIGNDGTHIIKQSQVSDDWDFDDIEISSNLNDKTGEPKVRTSTANVEQTFKNINLKKQANLSGNIDDIEKSQEEEKIADADNQAVYKDLMREIENPARPPRNMDEALDTLWKVESYLSEETREQLKFRTESGFLGTFKNAFCKFLGLFCKSFAEKRTQELNDQIDAVVRKITDEIKKGTDFGKNLQQQIFVPILHGDNIDEELKTTCLRLFSNEPKFQKELFQKIEKPSSDVLLYALEHWKKEIKNGKLFGKDICDQWLTPLMNNQNTTKETKLKLYTLFNDNPETQDKLFKSLKNPPNEIRKDFLEKHEQEIVSGKFFGFVGSDKDNTPYGVLFEGDIKNLFLNNEYPLTKLFLTMAKARPDLDKSIFTNRGNWKLMQNSDQQKEYMEAACSLTPEQVLQSLENIKTIEYDNVAKDQGANIKKVLDFLKDPESGNTDVPKKDLEVSFYPTVVKDTLRSMHYSFVFGKTKIDLSELSKKKADDPKVFFQALKKHLRNDQGKCLLDDNQMKQLVNFIFYSPSQGYCSSQLGGIVYKPFAGDMSVQVAFKENKGPIVTIKNKNTYNFIGFIEPLDLPISNNEAPRVHTSGTLKLTYESPINASNANKYKISVEDYGDYVTFENP